MLPLNLPCKRWVVPHRCSTLDLPRKTVHWSSFPESDGRTTKRGRNHPDIETGHQIQIRGLSQRYIQLRKPLMPAGVVEWPLLPTGCCPTKPSTWWMKRCTRSPEEHQCTKRDPGSGEKIEDVKAERIKVVKSQKFEEVASLRDTENVYRKSWKAKAGWKKKVNTSVIPLMKMR